jgi:endonuclease YncB( thermonuclease family)
MPTRASWSFALACLIVLALFAAPAEAKRVDGVYTGVLDANVVVLDYGDGSYNVRIFGVEAPAAGQPFASEALEFVRQRVLGAPGGMRFRYRNADDEMVSRVFYRPHGEPNGAERDLALDLVAAGLAWVIPGVKYNPVNEGEVDQLTAALAEAQAGRRGIWSRPDPVAPWTFRGRAPSFEAEPSGASEGVNGNLDINMSKRSGADNECAIAKNPLNPLQLVTHCNSLTTPWRSTDGGGTWAVGGSIGSYCCDPNLAWDKFGNLYATFIDGALDSIVTRLSTDAGQTWSPLASFDSSGVDQPSVVATEISGGNVALWVVWNQGTMKAAGALVTGLGTVGAFGATQDANAGALCSFGDLTVAPAGKVIQVCGPQTGQDGGDLTVTVDPDGFGPLGFGAPIHPAHTNVGGFDFIPPQNSRSIDSETGVAYDRNPSSPHFGRLYLIYTEEVVNEQHDTDILIRHSTDDGTTWSTATRVNSDPAVPIRSQFLPRIATDPVSGNVAICWHDARNSGTNTAMEVWCDRTSPDAYPAFLGNNPVSDGASTSNGAGVEFGDYSGLTATGGFAHPTWADTSNSTGDNPNGTANFDAYVDSFSLVSADYTLGVTPPSQSVCAPANAAYTVNVGAFGGYTDPVTLSASGNPAGTTTGFSVNPVTPADTSVLTIGNTAGGAPGPATITVSATSTTGPKAVLVSLNLATSAATAPPLVSPADGATGVSTSAPLSWTAVASATGYDVEVDDDNDFSSPEYAATVPGTSTIATGLAADTLYNWRVRAGNACGGAFSPARTFQTALVYCSSPNLPIADNASASTNIVVPPGAINVADLNIGIEATHTWVGDVTMTLAHGVDTAVFFNRPGFTGSGFGCSGDNVDVIANDEGADGNIESQCGDAPAIFGDRVGGDPASTSLLANFDGASMSGTWTLTVQDSAAGDTGTLDTWCLYPALDTLPFIDGFESGTPSAWVVGP